MPSATELTNVPIGLGFASVTRLVETRSLPPHSPLPIAALPSISLSPKAPFPRSQRVLCLARRSLGKGGSLIPFAPLYLGCALSTRPLPRGFTGHVAHPIRSIVSRLRPQHSTATSRLCRPCRSSHSLHCTSAAPAALDRYLAALPAMSLIPFAPFGQCKGKRTNARDSSRRW